MGSIKGYEDQDFSGINGHLQHDYRHDDKKLATPQKMFVPRNSPLTDLMQVNHFQSLYNLCVAVCTLLFANAIIFYLAEPSKFWQDIDIMRFGTSKFTYFIIMWLLYHVYALAVLQGFKFWISTRNRSYSKEIDGFFLLLYVTSLLFMFVATAYTALKLGLPPLTGLTAGAEQVRVFMKIYSFVRENVPRVKKYQSKKDGDQQHHALCPSKSHFFYYLFIPTFMYKDSYPRIQKIQWENVFSNIFKFISVNFVAYCIFMRFNYDMFKNVGIQQFTRKEAALLTAGCIAFGAVMMFMLFYGIIHCWLNIFAELLRFADKGFYQDWWNCTSFSQHFRKWNTVVYDWLHTFIYKESQKLGCSRSVSAILVFFVSAFVHEYILCLALGYFFPSLLISYCTLGILVVFLSKQKTAQYWNVFMWIVLFCGWGVQIFCYSTEWYARINCPKEETIRDFFIPRTLDPSCVIMNFSL